MARSSFMKKSAAVVRVRAVIAEWMMELVGGVGVVVVWAECGSVGPRVPVGSLSAKWL